MFSQKKRGEAQKFPNPDYQVVTKSLEQNRGKLGKKWGGANRY
jgi:hypothetical protein